MNIIQVKYRFLRLSSNLLALVEIMPDSLIPEPSTCLYPQKPYLTPQRENLVRILYGQEGFDAWRLECDLAFCLAVKEAKKYRMIDYSTKSGTERDVILWNFLDPLDPIYWDEFVPLFDNTFELILRDE